MPLSSFYASEPRKEQRRERCGASWEKRHREGSNEERLASLDRWSRKALLESEHLTRDLHEEGSKGAPCERWGPQRQG